MWWNLASAECDIVAIRVLRVEHPIHAVSGIDMVACCASGSLLAVGVEDRVVWSIESNAA